MAFFFFPTLYTLLATLHLAFFPTDLSELMKEFALEEEEEEEFATESRIASHTYITKDHVLDYDSVVGHLPILDDQEKPIANLFYVAYFAKEDEERPITFFFPGGPGGSCGAEIVASVGPRRMQTSAEGKKILPPYQLIDNPQSLLPWTDLVFVDPPGTGYSKWAKSKLQAHHERQFFQTEKDLEALGEFVERFIQTYRKWNSPKYLAGISYGASRCCGLTEELLQRDISLHGIILLSPAIDYLTLISQHNLPLAHSFLLPTYAATAWYHGRLCPDLPLEKILDHAKNFCYQQYLPLMLRPSRLDSKELIRFYTHLSQLIGLSPETVMRYGGKFEEELYTKEFFGAERKVLGGLDTRYASDISPYSSLRYEKDPSYYDTQGLLLTLKSYLEEELEFELPQAPYISYQSSCWNFQTYDSIAWPEFLQRVERSLIYNPQMKIFTGCGYFDCRTPFMAVEYSFDHLHPLYKNQLEFAYYEGGHGFIFDYPCLQKLQEDLIRFYELPRQKAISHLQPCVPKKRKITQSIEEENLDLAE